MSSTSQYLSVASGHIDSLISYVIDVKPYHVKLSEVVEQYLFEESINVKIKDEHSITAFLGSDILPNTLTTPGVRRRRSASWAKNIISDGSRRTWPVPITAINKFASQNSQDKFTLADSAVVQGFPSSGVFNLKRWDGNGITDVRKNGQHQHESLDYFLSYGAFSFDIKPNQKWKETNLMPVVAFRAHDGNLSYKDVISNAGIVSNIQDGNYEEWVLTCTSISPVMVSVVGSQSGFIGEAAQGQQFVDPKITFDFNEASAESVTEIGDKFVLTPAAKITIHPDAEEETWSLIKTNPIAMSTSPVFTSSHVHTVKPGIKIHTSSLDRNSTASTWTIVFHTNGTYTLNRYSASNSYSLSLDLKDGCSFKNDDIHFTIIPTGNGFYSGDSFSFSTNARVENYLVYGSKSGWQHNSGQLINAKIGEWYWNGKIGFKIPPLDYFVETYNSTIIVSPDASDASWNTVVSNNQILRNVTFNNGIFVTAGDDQIVGGSVDGNSWTSKLSTIMDSNPNDIVVITGDNGSVATTTDNGITWVKHDTGVTHNLRASTLIPNFLTQFNPDLSSNLLNCIIVVGDSGSIITSVDGVGWAIRDANTSENLNGIAWSNDCIVAVGSNGVILRSLDRLNWSQVNSSTTSNLNDVIYNSDLQLFVAVGNDGVILTSINGIDWLNTNAFNSGVFASIAYGNNKFVTVGPEGWIAESEDGISWSRYKGKRLNSIAFGNNKFVATGGNTTNAKLFTACKTVHSTAEPCVYTITFTSPTTATVHNNIYGYKHGLVPNQNWEDEFVCFKLSTDPDVVEYQYGDVVKIYLAPKNYLTVDNLYDVQDYDTTMYDTLYAEITKPLLYNEEYFPLYHSHGAVIFKPPYDGNFTDFNSLDTFTIDKASRDNILFQITGANLKYPELASVNSSIPLEFRFYDRLINGVPSSPSTFSDLTTYIEAYLCSDPSVKVFSINQPRYGKTNRNASATLTFDEDFFTNYLPFNTRYVLMFLTDATHGQRIRVKISENLFVYSTVSFKDFMNVEFVEGGILPMEILYDEIGYDDQPYDDGFMMSPTTTPSFSIKDTELESATTDISEGLTIVERTISSPNTIDRMSLYYDAAPLVVNQVASKYLVTHNSASATPIANVESLSNPGVIVPLTINNTPYPQKPLAISSKSFTFQLPVGVTAPFKLTIL